MRKTKIVATVGPACSDDAILLNLIESGVDVFRINASHTTPQTLKKWICKIRSVSKSSLRNVGLMVDLQGPRVRTGLLADGKSILVTEGEFISIHIENKAGESGHITTRCLELPKMVKTGDPILIDNGYLELKVLKVHPKRIDCKVIAGGILGENKGINLPNAPVTLPALGVKDQQDLRVAIQEGVDFIALSFVRSENDVETLKEWLTMRKQSHPVIAKIEKPRAVQSIAEIVARAGGIMVARGDLGIEMGVEKIPVVQKHLIQQSNQRPIPIITATQMLESMIGSPRPTRAEASDVANAVFDGTDAVMLSGETSVGKYPVQTVQIMAKIVSEAEHAIGETSAYDWLGGHSHTSDLFVRAMTHATRHAAKDLKAKAIVVFTRTGKSAALLSKFRPLSPIIALTATEEVSRRLSLFRGVYAYPMKYKNNIDQMIREADKVILTNKILKKGDCTVVLSGRLAFPNARYMTKIHLVGE